MNLTKKQLLVSLRFLPLLTATASLNLCFAVKDFSEGRLIWASVSSFFVVALGWTSYLHYRCLRDSLK